MSDDIILAAVMPVERRTAIVKESDMWIAMAEQVKAFVVHDDASAKTAAGLAKQLREIYRAKEDERKTITTPLLAAKNATDAYFKRSTEAILAIKRHYEQEIARYDLERERARAAKLAESAAQIAARQVPTAIIPEPVHVDKTSVRHVWEPEIVDADAVPREFCSPDLQKIRDAIWYANTPHKPPQEIPGVRFTLKSTVTVR